MSKNMSITNLKSSPSPSNGHRQTVGDGASAFATSSDSFASFNKQSAKSEVNYYSTAFSGGPGWRF